MASKDALPPRETYPNSISTSPSSPLPMSPSPSSPMPMSSPMSPQPMSPQPMSPLPMSPQPMSPQPISPLPMSPLPMSPPDVTSTNISVSTISTTSSLTSTVSTIPSASLSTGSSQQQEKRRSNPRPPSVIIETRDARTRETQEGLKQINNYLLKREIGRGAFGIVHLGIDTQTKEEVAIKEFSKSRLRRNNKTNYFRRGPNGRGLFRGRGRGGLGVNRGSERPPEDDDPLLLVRGEIAILKKLNHNNVVKMFEVLDDPNDDSLYMVFEMCSKGVVMDVSVDSPSEPYSDDDCRKWFRQMILGFEYLHENDIVHRDIKPDNLLIADNDTLKIVDFGVSEMFVKGSDLMKKSAGSPAFMSPELCHAHHGEVSGKAADIWSMGATLYCLRYGRLPFIKSNVLELYESIKSDPVVYDESTSPVLLDLFDKILEKDPQARITMDELRDHSWVTLDGAEPLPSTKENCSNLVTEVTEEEVQDAIKPIANIFVVMKAITKFRRHSHSRSRSKDTGSMLSESIKELPADDNNEDSSAGREPTQHGQTQNLAVPPQDDG